MGNVFQEKYLILFANIILAGVCGFCIGLERRKRLKEAGIRTHAIVAVGSALIMAISMSLEGSDPSRIAAQIVSGIGFLGAGMIFFRRESLRGLTTAAGIWATAGIGMAAGAGMYLLCIGTTLFLVVLQLLFHSNLGIFQGTKMHLLSVKFEYSDATVVLLKEFFGVDRFTRFKIFESGDGKISAEAVIHTDRKCDSETLARLIKTDATINSFERLEDL